MAQQRVIVFIPNIFTGAAPGGNCLVPAAKVAAFVILPVVPCTALAAQKIHTVLCVSVSVQQATASEQLRVYAASL